MSQYYSSLDMADIAYYYIYELAHFKDHMYGLDEPNIIRLPSEDGLLHVYSIAFFDCIYAKGNARKF